MTIPPFTMRRSDGGNIVESRDDYRAYSTIPGFHRTFNLNKPEDYLWAMANCGGTGAFRCSVVKPILAAKKKKPNVRPALEAAKKKATPKGETPSQTKKRSEDYAKKQVEKSKACGKGKAWSSKENKCVDLESTKVAVHPSVAQSREAAKKLGIGPVEQKFGSFPISQAAKILTAKRSGQDTRRLLEGMKFIKTQQGQKILQLRQALEDNNRKASAAANPQDRQGWLNSAQISRRAMEKEYDSWKQTHYASGYAKNPGLAETAGCILDPGACATIKQIKGTATDPAGQAIGKLPVPQVAKGALGVVRDIGYGTVTGEGMEPVEVVNSIATNLSGIDSSKLTGNIAADTVEILRQLSAGKVFQGFGFTGPADEGSKKFSDIPGQEIVNKPQVAFM